MRILLPALLCFVLSNRLMGDELPVQQDETATVAPASTVEATAVGTAAVADSSAKRWLLLCCGLPGDDDHRQKMTEACRKIISASEPVLGVAPDHLRFLAGDDDMHSELSELTQQSDICTSETVQTALKMLADSIPPDDSCWVIVIGHAHLYGARSQYNVMDKDFDQKQFGEWASQLICKEQVFWLTTPVSGFWIRPRKSDNRIVISATEADLEFTGTEMPYALADVLAGDAEHSSLTDIDQDGEVSLLDLYLATNLEIDGRFKALERLQTEHAQLDDNGDGRGSEVQQPYLPPEKKDEPEVESESAEPEEKTDIEAEGADSKDNVAKAGAVTTEPDPAVAKPAIVLPKPVSNPNLDGYRSRFVRVKGSAE